VVVVVVVVLLLLLLLRPPLGIMSLMRLPWSLHRLGGRWQMSRAGMRSGATASGRYSVHQGLRPAEAAQRGQGGVGAGA
jgi:hypothetical protein